MSSFGFVPQPVSVTATEDPLVVATSELESPGGILHEKHTEDLGGGAYRLSVTSRGAVLSAGDSDGLANGRATWHQLVDSAEELGDGNSQITGVAIEDEPRYSWRGVMIDCSRHFTPVGELRKIIDLLALHRMNRLHLHLTDDQGWRVEIEGWPLLTEIGSTRRRTLRGHYSNVERGEEPQWNEAPHGGYYTQNELRELVDYASERGVVIVPEIDLPGHMQAAVASYPDLGNLTERVRVGEIWGVSDHVLAPTEQSMRFVRDVLNQIIDIFPSPWIHIGGDECPTTEWEHSAQAQQFMAEKGLKAEREIQHEFMKVANEVIEAAGRQLVGWDEILEANPPANAVAMVWRPNASIAQANEAGLPSVYAHVDQLYFDYAQSESSAEPLSIGGLTTLADTYSVGRILSELPEAERESVLGAQGQVWREYIATNEHLEYMLLPRMCALSEAAWGTAGDYDDFIARLKSHHLARLRKLGANFRPLD